MSHKMDEEALIVRANEEREKLFQRYDRGREQGAEIDPWEDPGFEVYHQTDRYGFIHDRRLPQKVNPNEAKACAIELERVKKWLKMLNKWNSKDEKLRKRVYKGIPDKLRSLVWMKLLNLDVVMKEKKNVYQQMLKLARQWSTEARQIDSDVNRQFREHLFYRERYSIKQKSLFNVLTAYSMYNMEVGYCQGMSGLAGVLLMYMDEEEAFWALSVLLSDKKYAMHGLYIEGFPKLTRFLAHHDKIVAKFLPKIKKHFDQYNLDSILYSLKWFFVIFVERIPFSLCLRVWDIYLLDGERVVTGMAYNILRLHKNKILKLKDMDLIVQYLQVQLHKDFGYDEDHVIKMLEQSMDELRRAKLDLPPPADASEYPKRPFGEFTEPSLESKIGRRKPIFTETEREVTENVILRRELTAQVIAESRISEGAIGGSNSQLNAGQVADSEDGGSLLGSSRKSLADTSVTSTADLSVFSGGQRSQQAFDICIDDNHSIQSEDGEGEGESSPGSAFCSLSVVGRTPSAMMITPTPRAISPQDIVRIYVPPAPPEELLKLNGSSQNINATINADSVQYNQKHKQQEIENHDDVAFQQFDEERRKSNRNSIVSGDMTPIRNSAIYRSEEELMQTLSDFGAQNGRRSTSSSRRGSMSRKSPSSALESDFIIECSHMKSRKFDRNTSEIRDDNSTCSGKALCNSAGEVKVSTNGQFIMKEDERHKKLMTSFEELAVMKNEESSRMYHKPHHIENRMSKSENYSSPSKLTSDEEEFSYSYYSAKAARAKQNSSKFSSDCNIQYKASISSIGDSTEIEYKSLKGRKSSSGTDGSPYEHNSHIQRTRMANKKPYNRFFGTGDDDDEEDDEDIEGQREKLFNKSSDDSSSSPTSKSLLTTPINETVPLLLMSSSSTHNESKYVDGIGNEDDNDYEDDSFDSDYPPVNKTPISSPTSSQYHTRNTSNRDDYSYRNPNTKVKSPTSNRPSKIPLYHQSSASSSPSSSFSMTSRNISNENMIRPQIEFDNRIAAPLGGVYDFSISSKNQSNRGHQKSATAVTTTAATTTKSNNPQTNKIRIKINQKQYQN